MKMIAIDFDGTICVEKKFPDCGEIRSGAIEVIRELHKKGYVLQLNTCREREVLKIAKTFLARHGILKCFKYINENPLEQIMIFGGDCRKLEADLFIDDKCLFFPRHDKDFWYKIPMLVDAYFVNKGE